MFHDLNLVSLKQTKQTRHKGEKATIKWLNENVMTDPIYDLVEDLAWEVLWDSARKMKKKQADELERTYRNGGPIDTHMKQIIRENYSKPLNRIIGASLINHSWGELLYYTNLYMRRSSLAENYAIQKMQQKIIAQVTKLINFKISLKFRLSQWVFFSGCIKRNDP